MIFLHEAISSRHPSFLDCSLFFIIVDRYAVYIYYCYVIVKAWVPGLIWNIPYLHWNQGNMEYIALSVPLINPRTGIQVVILIINRKLMLVNERWSQSTHLIEYVMRSFGQLVCKMFCPRCLTLLSLLLFTSYSTRYICRPFHGLPQLRPLGDN